MYIVFYGGTCGGFINVDKSLFFIYKRDLCHKNANPTFIVVLINLNYVFIMYDFCKVVIGSYLCKNHYLYTLFVVGLPNLHYTKTL